MSPMASRSGPCGRVTGSSMLKIVTLFLVVIVVLALFSRWRIGPDRLSGPGKPLKCPKCQRFLIGKGPCDCGTRKS